MNSQTKQELSGRMMGLSEATALIRGGGYFSIAGDELLLRELPRGHWIGGTIPYFMGQDGGVTTRDQLYVAQVPVSSGVPLMRFYDQISLERVCADAPENGFSIIVIPAFSAVHSLFARNAPGYEDMYLKPLIGWISGIHLDDLGRASPLAVNGETLEFEPDRALVMHVPLPADKYAHIDIINLFTPGEGDSIRFPAKGFSVGECRINGEPANFARYVTTNAIDTRLPLVADYSGAMINVSIKAVDLGKGVVDFYAPVFDDVEYRFAAPVPDYVSAFQQALRARDGGQAGPVGFSCNCVLNYLYSELEGKRVPSLLGPMTYGEVAYQLLNQTLVYLTIEG